MAAAQERQAAGGNSNGDSDGGDGNSGSGSDGNSDGHDGNNYCGSGGNGDSDCGDGRQGGRGRGLGGAMRCRMEWSLCFAYELIKLR